MFMAGAPPITFYEGGGWGPESTGTWKFVKTIVHDTTTSNLLV